MANVADFTSKLEAANTAYKETIDALGDVFPGTYNLFSEDLGPADGEKVNIGYTEDLGEVRVMQPGESRQFAGLRAFGAEYNVEEIYTGHTLARKRVEYDSSGRIARGLKRAAERGFDLIESEVWRHIKANTITGVDGVALVSASHASGAVTQSNLTTTALGHPAYRAGKAAMRALVRENGQPYDMNPTHLFVPTGSEDIGREVIGENRAVALDNAGAESGTRVAAATINNVYVGDTILVVTPRMASGTWLLMDLGKPGVRPWAHSFGRQPEAIMPEPNDESIKKLAMLEYILSGDVAMGPAHWQSIYGKIA
jgi:hypothetical protein